MGLDRVGVGSGADGRVQLNVSEGGGGGEEEGFITRMHMFVLKVAPCQPLERTSNATSIRIRGYDTRIFQNSQCIVMYHIRYFTFYV